MCLCISVGRLLPKAYACLLFLVCVLFCLMALATALVFQERCRSRQCALHVLNEAFVCVAPGAGCNLSGEESYAARGKK